MTSKVKQPVAISNWSGNSTCKFSYEKYWLATATSGH